MMKFVMCADGCVDIAVNVGKIVSIAEKPFRNAEKDWPYYEDRVDVVVEGGEHYTYVIGGCGCDVVERAVELLGVELVDRR